MDSKVNTFYRQIFADLKLDNEESAELMEYYQQLNPPPDKLVWLRASAFRIGSEFLSEDNRDTNVSVIRTINAIVHCLEKTCMLPKEQSGHGTFDPDAAEELIRGMYSDLTIDNEENETLFKYFTENTPAVSGLVTLRAKAFKAAVEYLTDDKAKNIQLLKCINVVVHAFERVCLLPKKYELKLPPTFNLDVSLSDAVQELWNLDVNRLTPNADYEIYVQGGKKPFWKGDEASDPLFTFVDKAALNRPTYQTFMALLDNYKAETGQAENVTATERREESAFLNAILQTAPMQFCHKYAHQKGKASSSTAEFKQLLYKMWFELYNRERGGPKDSSGFEHVFVGEVKDGQISGFHNWIQLYMEEQKGALDYKGYIKPRGRQEAATNSDDHVLTIQFAWKGVEKGQGSSFIGVSPEFEMALYTLCALVGEEDNEVTLNTGTDEFVLNIKCYKFGPRISTSFPMVTEHYD